jgi:hypothetical protein
MSAAEHREKPGLRVSADLSALQSLRPSENLQVAGSLLTNPRAEVLGMENLRGTVSRRENRQVAANLPAINLANRSLAANRGVANLMANPGAVNRGVVNPMANPGAVNRGVVNLMANPGAVNRGVANLMANPGAANRGVANTAAATRMGPTTKWFRSSSGNTARWSCSTPSSSRSALCRPLEKAKARERARGKAKVRRVAAIADPDLCIRR